MESFKSNVSILSLWQSIILAEADHQSSYKKYLYGAVPKNIFSANFLQIIMKAVIIKLFSNYYAFSIFFWTTLDRSDWIVKINSLRGTYFSSSK